METNRMSTNRRMNTTLTGTAPIVAIVLLGGCASAPADLPAAAVPPGATAIAIEPPEIPAQSIEQALRAESSATAARVDEPERVVFPGFVPRAVVDDQYPFERRVAERKKRVELGIEAPRREIAPVNNVIDWEF